MHSLNKQKVIDYLILLPVLWAFTGMFLYPNGRKLMVVLVLISAIASFYSYGIKSILENIKTNKIVWLLGAYSLFALLAKTHYGYSSSLMRGLICLLVYLAVFPPSLTTKIDVKHLIVIGAISSFIFVMIQTFIFNHGRMGWGINPIPYATYSASLSILSFYYLLQSKELRSCILWLSTFTMAVIPLMYSQSRGLWVALSVVMVIAILKSLVSYKKSLYLLGPFIIFCAAAIFFSAEKIEQRIDLTQAEVQQIMAGNLETSIGWRLQMWKAGGLLAGESPIIGLGDKHLAYKQELAEQDIISQKTVQFTHYHNQFLNDLVKYGIVGLGLLLLTILLPLYYLKKNNNEYTWPGFLIIATFIIASLTDVPFQHAQTLTLYFIMIYFFVYTSTITKTCLAKNNVQTVLR